MVGGENGGELPPHMGGNFWSYGGELRSQFPPTMGCGGERGGETVISDQFGGVPPHSGGETAPKWWGAEYFPPILGGNTFGVPPQNLGSGQIWGGTHPRQNFGGGERGGGGESKKLSPP